MAAPFQTVPQRIRPVIGARMMLDILAEAESAELSAKQARARAQKAAAEFGATRGYRVALAPEQARTIAKFEEAERQRHEAQLAEARRAGQRILRRG